MLWDLSLLVNFLPDFNAVSLKVETVRSWLEPGHHVALNRVDTCLLRFGELGKGAESLIEFD